MSLGSGCEYVIFVDLQLSEGFKVKKFEEKPQGERIAYMSMDVEECAVS
jgi:hypothetical protein